MNFEILDIDGNLIEFLSPFHVKMTFYWGLGERLKIVLYANRNVSFGIFGIIWSFNEIRWFIDFQLIVKIVQQDSDWNNRLINHVFL
jgi:hypothetical protein